jgi:hypothetical protein
MGEVAVAELLYGMPLLRSMGDDGEASGCGALLAELKVCSCSFSARFVRSGFLRACFIWLQRVLVAWCVGAATVGGDWQEPGGEGADGAGAGGRVHARVPPQGRRSHRRAGHAAPIARRRGGRDRRTHRRARRRQQPAAQGRCQASFSSISSFYSLLKNDAGT